MPIVPPWQQHRTLHSICPSRPAVDERLRKECKLLQALGTLCCRACGRALARSADAVQVRGLAAVQREEAGSCCCITDQSCCASTSCPSVVGRSMRRLPSMPPPPPPLLPSDERGGHQRLLRQLPLLCARHRHALAGGAACRAPASRLRGARFGRRATALLPRMGSSSGTCCRSACCLTLRRCLRACCWRAAPRRSTRGSRVRSCSRLQRCSCCRRASCIPPFYFAAAAAG